MIDQQLSDTTLSVSKVAESFRISPRYLSMLLKSDGTTFGRYVLTQRLDKASLALKSPLYSDIPISQIAWKFGFSDMAYFSRAFRQKFSYSPTEYRHQAGKA